MSANRSSVLNLYASEDKSDNDKRVEFSASNADFDISGAQDLALDFNAYQFSKMVSGAKVTYDLETRFDAIESDATGANNAAAISQLQVDLASEQNARISADTSNSNAVTAETNARVAAVQAVQDALDVQEAKQVTDDAAQSTALAAEIADRQTAVSAEASSRASDIAGLQSQISNILSNSDAAALDSLAEVLSHLTSEDTSILAAVATAQALADSNKQRLDELLDQQ